MSMQSLHLSCGHFIHSSHAKYQNYSYIQFYLDIILHHLLLHLQLMMLRYHFIVSPFIFWGSQCPPCNLFCSKLPIDSYSYYLHSTKIFMYIYKWQWWSCKLHSPEDVLLRCSQTYTLAVSAALLIGQKKFVNQLFSSLINFVSLPRFGETLILWYCSHFIYIHLWRIK